MRMPTKARSRASTSTLLAAMSLLLAACAGEVTAPGAERSPLAPSDASMALMGVVDGSYQFTIDPSKDQSLKLGPNHLDIPAHSVCDLDSSGYGSDYWNRSCRAEGGIFTITAVVKYAASSHPQINFEPALRFNPDKIVQLYIYQKHVRKNDRSFVMMYCVERTCVDEALKDEDLRTQVDKKAGMVFRRIKHFSGYVVAEFASDALQF